LFVHSPLEKGGSPFGLSDLETPIDLQVQLGLIEAPWSRVAPLHC
jgi:hypothetical protein